MNIKKFLFVVASLCAIIVCASGCKKASKDKEEESVTASLKLDPSANADFNSIGSISYSCIIKDQKGMSRNQGVLGSVKEFNNINCPCTITLEYSYTLLSGKGIDESKSYSLSYGPTFKIKTTKTSREFDDVMSATLKGSELTDWFKLINTSNNKCIITIDKNGKITID